MTSHVGKHETSYSISKLSAKFQFCAIHTADNTDGKVTGCGKKMLRPEEIYHDTGTKGC